MDLRRFVIYALIGFMIAYSALIILTVLDIVFGYAQEVLNNPYDVSNSKIYIPVIT